MRAGTAGQEVHHEHDEESRSPSCHRVRPSRFGYLRTPLPAGATHARQADAFAALLDALDAPSAAVMAVSAGAASAAQLALRHPERVQALVLITPALGDPPPRGGGGHV
jgi:pimeloyl-ACP methyl ester carboxylesterase